jgi:uncharacterized protein involved in exopolysaccharide biosynthesis
MNQGKSRQGSLPPLPDDGLDGGRAPGPNLIDWGLLVLRAAWRRKWIAIAVFLVGIDAAAVYYRTKAPVYRVEARILAQRQQSLPSVVRPGAPDDAPTRSAWEIVHRRENLIALIRETNLLPAPGTTPARAGLQERLRRAVAGLTGRPLAPAADEDPMDALVRRLDQALEVTTAEGTITVAILWPDPQQAYRLVEGALQNFLEARHLQEVTAIDEVISLLHGRAATLRDQLERAVEEARRQAVRDGSRLARMTAPLALPPQPSEDLVRLKSMLDAKERAIADVEEFRRRRLADLQAQLDAQRGVYSEAHPSIINLRQDIEALSRDSPQMAALREEEGKLRRAYAARLAQEGRRSGPGSAGMAGVGASPPGAIPSVDDNERVREARFQYQHMLERVNAAQLDLDAARAAFKYRYNVIWPPEVPRQPVSPKPEKIFGMGAIASFLLALFAAAVPDLRSGRIVERWQVERSLDLPILGDLGRK